MNLPTEAATGIHIGTPMAAPAETPAGMPMELPVEMPIELSIIHIPEPTRLLSISYDALFLKKKNN